MVPVKKHKTPFAAAALVVCAIALCGCETTPPDTGDYWPQTNGQEQAEAHAEPRAQATYLTVRVHDGDTLADIAGRYSVSRRTIARMNDLSESDGIYAGQTLKLPAGPKQTRKAVLAEAVQPHYASWNAPGIKPTVTVQELSAPVVHRAPPAESVQAKPKTPIVDAALTDEASDEIVKATTAKTRKKESVAPTKAAVASPAKATASAPAKGESATPAKTASISATATAKPSEPVAKAPGEFEWPVEGKVIARFGKDEGGARNDGINIAADLGTPIHAAAAGTVTYAGNELKSYGNLVLIKHENGYVTAYAHAERIAVSRGDHVDRGDVIGYAGATGDVSSPQLHFEIRQGVKPIDPKPLLVASRES
jgi:murein DD-endopeptidase MepM/ murein hydrolase activator NlpD